MEDTTDIMDTPYSILLVEDIPDHAHLMEIKLKSFNTNFTINTVTNGPECLRMVNQSHFDLVVLDYMLPGMNGLEILKNIKGHYPEMPVIIVTGQGDEQLAVQALKHGATDYIIKERGYEKFLPQVVKQFIEKRQLEKMLVTTELRYQNLFELANDAIFIEEIGNGELLDTNLKATQLTGFTKAELMRMKFRDLRFEDSALDITYEIPSEADEPGQELDKYIMLRKDGQLRQVEVSSSMVNLGNFRVRQNIVRDVTEKRKLEQLILESKKRHQALFDGITDFISVQDKNFNIIMVNRQLAERCKTTPEKLIGRKCFRVYFGRKTRCDECPLVHTFKDGKSILVERIFNSDIYELNSFPMHGVNNKLEYVTIHGKLMTEQKQLEKKYIQSEKLATIGILASGVAHELRNPLNVIETARYAIQTEVDPDNESINRKLITIKNHVQRAARIINNLLEFSRPAAQNISQIDVNHVLETTLVLVTQKMELKGIKLIKDFRNIPKACFNLDSLKQAFLNIIINAIQAMPNGGELKIQTDEDDGRNVKISFSDTGMGISKENLNRLFTPFFTTKEQGEGTGLGMYITHSIIERYGGEITVESEQSKGTTVHIVLPIQVKKRPV